MATIRLIPSTYYLSSSTYLSVSNAANMYTNTDSDTYATVTNSQNGTTSYYIYIRGFNFDDIPSAAVINSFSIKLKARESGITTSTSYPPKLCNGTSQLTSTCSQIGTTATTYTFSGYDVDLDDIKSYGDDFGIRINCRRASRNTTGYMYIYGAEIEIDYTIPDPRTITTSVTGNGTISPSGSTTTYDGQEFELTITPNNISDTVTITKNGTDVSSELVGHSNSQTTLDAVLGNYTLVSGSFNGSGASYFSGLEGNGVDSSKTTSNYYSGGSGTIAVFTYDMNFTLPSNAIIERVYCQVNGHAESSSNSSEYMCAQLISGNTEITEEINFKDVSTSNTTVTLEAETLPTVAQLANMQLRCRLGYYGGAINGATCYVIYSLPQANPDYYTYTFTVNGNATIAVQIGSVAPPANKIYIKVKGIWTEADTIFVKDNGTWQEVNATWLKNNGSWVQQDKSGIFDSRRRFVAYDPGNNGYDYVDLELPSGTLWATMNVGANSPTSYGNYYAWGEISTKSNYTNSTYTKGNSYSTSEAQLDFSDDVARISWEGKWCIPTREQWQELINNCTWTWTTVNSIKGYNVSNNGKTIFLPGAGRKYATNTQNYPDYGYYWSAIASSAGYAYYVEFGSSYYDVKTNNRYYGHPIRPVITP